MKRNLLVLVILFTVTSFASAQEERIFCNTTERYLQAVRSNPQILQTQKLLEVFTQRFTQQNQVSRTSSVNPPTYVIPLVFHIIHNYGQENISDAQVIDQVNILNRDYRKLNSDTVDVVPAFKPIIADCDIEFRLATIDPNGNCTNGIDRIQSNLTYKASDDSKLNPWPHDQYLNIWVIHDFNDFMSGVAAYAFYPSMGDWDPTHDGVICLYDYIGSIEAGTPGRSRVLTHEIGHILNLQHPWGDTNEPGVACGDDLVGDTPETVGWTSCNLGASVCNPPQLENVQNYMDYAYCDKMFTLGQAARMQGALNSSTGGRSNLWTINNRNLTGTNGGPIQVCVPTADFYSNYRDACQNNTITFQDLSWNGKPTSWNWFFENGNPATSTDSAPSVLYSIPGFWNVKLTVSNATGTDSVTKSTFIHVSGPPTYPMPYTESFETPATFPGTDGYTINPDNGFTWARVTNAASTGTSSIKINNYNNPQGEIDDWISSSFDFSNINQPVLTFQVANAQRNTSADQLKVYGTYNCGRSWYVKWSDYGSSLSTAGVVATSFTPNASQWRQISVNLNQFQGKANVRLKFQNISDQGNNTYIDDINITGNITSVDEVDEIELGFAIYPNPTSGNSTIQFQLANNRHVSLQVKDVLGQTVNAIADELLNSGMHEYRTSLSVPGIYFVDLIVDGKHHVRKLIIV